MACALLLAGCGERPIPGAGIEADCGRFWLFSDGKGHRWLSSINWESAAVPVAPGADIKALCAAAK
jgi:hypothetical protein